MNNELEHYVLLPNKGVRGRSSPSASVLANLPRAFSIGPSLSARIADAGPSIAFVDSIHEDGPKLVSLDKMAAEEINRSKTPLRAFPIVSYGPPNPPLAASTFGPQAVTRQVTIRCVDAVSGSPVVGANVVAFTNFQSRQGAQDTTNANGDVNLTLPGNLVDRLYVYAPAGYWGAFRSNIALNGNTTVQLRPVNLTFQDSVRRHYGSSRFNAAASIVVGIIDTGVGPHHDLNVVAGRNTVTGEPRGDYADSGEHGTHVAGLVGAHGVPPNGLRGVAPGVSIRAYRVFGQGSEGATNYAILKALIFAADEGCDIVNLSLGGGPYDAVVEEAIADARQQGMMVVIAAGNDGRQRVSYPAAYAGAMAISAMGCTRDFPPNSLDEGAVLRPPFSTADVDEFIADFSNVGPQVAVVGHGVGVLSTLPNHKYGPLSGTSMAAPVVVGAAASLLSQHPNVAAMPRDEARAAAIEKLLQSNCTRRGFGANYEGYGMPDPASV